MKGQNYQIPQVEDFCNSENGISLWKMLAEKQMLDTETEKLCYAIGANDEGKNIMAI